MEIQERNTRLIWVDILRFIGIFAIVWGHTLTGGPVHFYLYSFHIPLFFCAIGFCFKTPKQSFWQFTKKKAYSLLIPFFLFAIISILLFSVLGNFAGSTLGYDLSANTFSANIIEVLRGKCRANRPLWFLPCVFIFYLLCFFLSRLIDNKSKKKRYAIMFVVTVAAFALCVLNAEVFRVSAFFWKAEVAIFMLPFFVLALIAKPFLTSPIKSGVHAVLCPFFLLSGAILAKFNDPIGCLYNSYGNVFLFYLSAICSILGLCLLSIILSQIKLIAKVLTYVGQRTMSILLMHKFPIVFFQVVFPWTKQPMKENNALVGLLVTLISISLCLVVDVFMRKYLPFFVGQRMHSVSKQHSS
ncbi:MAG: acyltransferase family protein [Clostridia bacterium]|nr:acyltransferase family protein [Clostridia bacterium]